MSLLVFYATTMGYMGSNRQLLALGICLYALRFIKDKNTLKWVFLSFVNQGLTLFFVSEPGGLPCNGGNK